MYKLRSGYGVRPRACSLSLLPRGEEQIAPYAPKESLKTHSCFSLLKRSRTWEFEGCRNQDFCGHLTLCSCKACQAGPDHEVMKGPDHVEIGEAEGIVGVHDSCRDELRAGWRIATEQR